jgi:hypothetical protein
LLRHPDWHSFGDHRLRERVVLNRRNPAR